jgi:hypothetical protein
VSGFRRKEEARPPKVAVVQPKPDSEPPVFSFRYLQAGYCISNCTKDEKAALATKLREMSQLSWMQLQLAPREGLGKENIARGSIKPGIPKVITPDVTHFWAFRFHGNAPMVGFRSGLVFYVLWLDRAFTLYDH